MFKKLVLRSFLVLMGLFFAVVLSLAICGWLVFQESGSYVQLRDKTYTAEEREAVEKRMQKEMRSIELWAQQSVRNHLHALEAAVANETNSKTIEPAVAKQRLLTITQDDLNTVLSERRNSSGDFRNPRVQIFGDRIRLLGELALSKDSPIAISIDVRLKTSLKNQIKLEILGGKIGQLPVPLVWLLHRLPDESLPTDSRLEFHLSDPVPHLLFNPVAHKNLPRLGSIETLEGKVVLGFSQPVTLLQANSTR